jgi:4-carboxymuconolactone decarboxylase
VKPTGISEILTHLAYYASWGQAVMATSVIEGVFVKRDIGADQLPSASPQLLPIDQDAEDRRANSVE